MTPTEFPIYYSATYGQGTAPCRMVVSGGGIAVLDANNAILFSQGAYSPAGTPAGTLPANAVLTQVRLLLSGTLGDAVIKAATEYGGALAVQDSKLYSADATVCLIAQSDGASPADLW